jgi:hypothetical protein
MKNRQRRLQANSLLGLLGAPFCLLPGLRFMATLVVALLLHYRISEIAEPLLTSLLFGHSFAYLVQHLVNTPFKLGGQLPCPHVGVRAKSLERGLRLDSLVRFVEHWGIVEPRGTHCAV